MALSVNHDGEKTVIVHCDECGQTESIETKDECWQVLTHHLAGGHSQRDRNSN